MFHQHIVLPKKLNVVEEDGSKGVYEIEGLYPGYGHTLGNSLRRIILSSLPGVSIISVKIKGADHEFATLSGVKEDVLTILLNLKKTRYDSDSFLSLSSVCLTSSSWCDLNVLVQSGGGKQALHSILSMNALPWWD